MQSNLHQYSFHCCGFHHHSAPEYIQIKIGHNQFWQAVFWQTDGHTIINCPDSLPPRVMSDPAWGLGACEDSPFLANFHSVISMANTITKVVHKETGAPTWLTEYFRHCLLFQKLPEYVCKFLSTIPTSTHIREKTTQKNWAEAWKLTIVRV